MAVNESARHRMYLKLEEVLGREEASTLMEDLPPLGWGDLATRRDLENLAAASKRDLENLAAANKREHENLAAANKREHENLKRELDHFATTFRQNLEHLAALNNQDHERISDRFDAKLESKLNAQTRSLVALMSGQVVAVAALAFTAARLT